MLISKYLSSISSGRTVVRDHGIWVVEHDLKGSGGVGWFRVPAGKMTCMDEHKVREVWIVLAGRGKLFRGEQEHEVLPGSIFGFAPFQPHQLFASLEQAVTVTNIWWKDD